MAQLLPIIATTAPIMVPTVGITLVAVTAGFVLYRAITTNTKESRDIRIVKDSVLNASTITGHLYSVDLEDDDEIQKFYSQNKKDEHGYLIFKTPKETFMCHLVGTEDRSLNVVIEKAGWEPDGMVVWCPKYSVVVRDLKKTIQLESTKFGAYVLNKNDCGTFAQTICQFLDQ
jgi:hypothetical protein